jgi:hypothetical protein
MQGFHAGRLNITHRKVKTDGQAQRESHNQIEVFTAGAQSFQKVPERKYQGALKTFSHGRRIIQGICA